MSGGLSTRIDAPQDRLTRLLLIESNADQRACLAAALGDGPEPTGMHATSSVASNQPRPGIAWAMVVELTSLVELHSADLAAIDLVVCNLELTDGSGLDALAYLRGAAPTLPVIVIGTADDAALGMEAIRAGALDFLVLRERDLDLLPLTIEKGLAHHRVRCENERLTQRLSRSLSDLAYANHQLHKAVRQLEATARTDELTGLANRRWLNLMLQGHWADATRHGLPLAFLMIDLDGFKHLNDRFGHHRGDEVLRLTARVIQTSCRDVDIAARLGGDEFGVLMPHTSMEQAAMVAQRLLHDFSARQRNLDANEAPNVSMSIGVAQIDSSRPLNAEMLVMHADAALYAAKGMGKNRVMVRTLAGMVAPQAQASLSCGSIAPAA